jgi:hypothetical protein
MQTSSCIQDSVLEREMMCLLLSPASVADLLIDTLTNIRRELKFFESVAKKYSLHINASEDRVSDGVKGYRELFFGTGEGIEKREVRLFDGLVLLWGTEIVRLFPLSLSLPFSPPLHP